MLYYFKANLENTFSASIIVTHISCYGLILLIKKVIIFIIYDVIFDGCTIILFKVGRKHVVFHVEIHKI